MNPSPVPVTIGVAVRYEEPQILQRFVEQTSRAAHLLDEMTESEVCFCLNGASLQTKGWLDDALRQLSDSELNFTCLESAPGKIRAHASISRHRSLHGYLLFVDADVIFDDGLFVHLYRFMQDNPAIHACYADVVALPSVAGGLFAHLQNAYYRNRDRLTPRSHLHGRCFMLRSWDAEFDALTAVSLPSPLVTEEDPLGLHHGPIVDDIHYSRVLAHRHGQRAIGQAPGASVHFVPPHSPAELYRDSCRTELELVRLDLLFPDHAPIERNIFGRRAHRHKLWEALWQAGLPAAAYVATELGMRTVARAKARRRRATLAEGGISPSSPPTAPPRPM